MQVIQEMSLLAEYRSITSVRGHVTRGINFLTKALDNNAGVPYLESQNTSLERKWNNYEERWDNFVEDYGEEDGHDDREASHNELTDRYHNVQLRLSLFLKQNKSNHNPSSNTSNPPFNP